jgi:hypothetical protein
MSENLPIKRRRSALRDSPEIRERIIAGISEGIPLAVICREDGMPSDDTVRNWADEDERFARDIARARECGFDQIAHRLRSTSRGRGESTGDVVRDKLIIDTDLKLLAKWDPKRYGDRPEIMIQNNNSNAGGMIELRPEQDEALQRVIMDAQDRVRKIP